jgi:hypothetical protein
LLPSPAVVASAGVEAPAELVLTPLQGDGRTLREWVTNFHLLTVVLDPYTNESSWILPTAQRIMAVYSESDCRMSWLVTGTDTDGAKAFLGPLAEQWLTFVDPDRTAVKALGLEQLPALVHIGTDLRVQGVAEGWEPSGWRAITANLTKVMSWGKVLVPDRGDPAPFAGTPALG